MRCRSPQEQAFHRPKVTLMPRQAPIRCGHCHSHCLRGRKSRYLCLLYFQALTGARSAPRTLMRVRLRRNFVQGLGVNVANVVVCAVVVESVHLRLERPQLRTHHRQLLESKHR